MSKTSDINADRERAQFLAASIFPGDGFNHAQDVNISGMLIELLAIVAKYDEKDDRDFIVYHVGEVIYPMTFEGQHVIQAFVDRAASSKAAPVLKIAGRRS
jgi:uncharacterized protein YtpQ (UPF0354 family)